MRAALAQYPNDIVRTIIPLSAGLLLMASASIWGVATIGLSNYDAEMPILLGGPGQTSTLAPVQGSYVELLANGLPVAPGSGGSSILPLVEAGYFYAGVGTIPGLADGSIVELTLRAWQNAASFEAAAIRGSVSWSQATGSWNPNSIPPSPLMGPALALTKSLVMTQTSTVPTNTSSLLATLSLDNYSAAMPIRLGTASQPGELAPIHGTSVELLVNGTPVAPAPNGSSILILTEPGYFYAGMAALPGVAAGGVAELTLRAWQNAASFDAASIRGSVTWSQTTGSWNPNASPPAPMTGPSLALTQPLYLGVPTDPPIPESMVATIGLSNYESGMPIKIGPADTSGVLAPVQGIYAELLANGQPVVSGGASVMALTDPGYFYAGIASIPGLKGGSTVQFTLRAWQDAVNFETASVRASVTWSQVTGSWNPNATPPVPMTGPALALIQPLHLVIPHVITAVGLYDFNQDGASDLLFQHQDGTLAIWLMKEGKRLEAQFLNPHHVEKGWRLACTGDFNQDNKQDLIFQHSNGILAVWYMSQTSMTAAELLTPAATGGNWEVKAAGDLNGDGKPDLVFQHGDGSLAVWFMDGSKMKSAQLLTPSHPGDARWQVAGLADFDADGQLDLLFQHRKDGDLAVWLMEGTSLKSAQLLNPPNPGNAQWKVSALADYNQDGKIDLILQNKGSLAVWYMNGIDLLGGAYLTETPIDPAWQVAGPR